MFEWEFEHEEHYLVGTLLVRVIEQASGRPLSGVRVGLGEDLAAACGEK